VNALTKEQSASRARTLLTSLLLSAPGPLVTGYALATSRSTTQLADFIRRGMELVAIFVSWWAFRKLQREAPVGAARQARLERGAGLSTAGAMAGSGALLLGVTLSRWSAFEPGGSVLVGLVITFLGLLTNGWLWRRYAALTREQYDAVIAGQQQLYRAKTLVDLCVITALVAVALAPGHPVTPYVDLLGSVGVAAYLLWSGVQAAQAHFTRGGGLRSVANVPEEERIA